MREIHTSREDIERGGQGGLTSRITEGKTNAGTFPSRARSGGLNTRAKRKQDSPTGWLAIHVKEVPVCEPKSSRAAAPGWLPGWMLRVGVSEQVVEKEKEKRTTR